MCGAKQCYNVVNKEPWNSPGRGRAGFPPKKAGGLSFATGPGEWQRPPLVLSSPTCHILQNAKIGARHVPDVLMLETGKIDTKGRMQGRREWS